MVRNYVAKIALVVIFRYVELKNPDFEIDDFIANLGEAPLSDFQLFDKYPIKDINQFIARLLFEVQGDNYFFLKLGLDGFASKIGSFSFFIQNSPNFRDLLHRSSQFSHIVTDLISNISMEDGLNYTKVYYNFSRDNLKFNSQSLSSILEASYGSLAVLYKEKTFSSDYQVSFHSAFTHNLNDQEISKVLGYEFHSGAERNFIVIPNAALDIKNSTYEANLPNTISQGLSKYLEMQNEESILSIITNLLEVKPASSLEDVSQSMHISKRTLQRRLKDKNINFSSIKQSVANQQSIDLLESHKYSIDEVGLMLGYSSTATFVHAFTKWHGMTPSAFLKRDKG